MNTIYNNDISNIEKIEKGLVKELSLSFGKKTVLNKISLPIYQNSITAIIGPSGCGKSTLLRCFNRMNDFIDIAKITGTIILDSKDIYTSQTDVYNLRMKVGLVFQKPNPFPKSIFENVAYGLRIQGKDKNSIARRVEQTLKDAWLWEEVKERLNESAFTLSGGQQQRLCIARALATNPELLLLDEATSALDPQSTKKIEELLNELKKNVTLITVTHNIAQAGRIADYTAFLYEGNLIEFNDTETIFTTPNVRHTENYIMGKFG